MRGRGLDRDLVRSPRATTPWPCPARERTELHDSLTEFQNDAARQPRHQPRHPVHQRDRRRAAQRRRLAAADDRRCPTSRARCPRSAGSASPPSRPGSAWPSPAGGSRCWCCGSFLSFGVFGYWQDSIDLLIITGVAVGARGAHRHAARGADRHQRAGQPGHHGRPRLHADDADLRLPAADRAVLRHRRRGRRRLRPSSTRCRRSSGSPASASARSRRRPSRRPTRPARPTGSGCSRCSSRWPARRSSSGSTRPPWRRCRWRRSRRSSTVPASASRCSTGLRINDVGGGVRARRAHRGDGGHARPHHDRGQRARREGRRAGRAATRGCAGSCWSAAAVVDARRDLPLAHLHGPGGVPDVLDRRQGSPTAVNDVIDWFTDTFGGVTGGFKDAITNGLLNPMQSLLAESPWYARRRGDLRARLRLRWPARPGDAR